MSGPNTIDCERFLVVAGDRGLVLSKLREGQIVERVVDGPSQAGCLDRLKRLRQSARGIVRESNVGEYERRIISRRHSPGRR